MKFLYLASALLVGTVLGQGQSDLVNECNKLTNNDATLQSLCKSLGSGNGNNPVLGLIQPCINKCTDDTCKQKCLTDLFTSVTGKNFDEIKSCSSKCKPDDSKCISGCSGISIPDDAQAKAEKCKTDCKDDSDCLSKCGLSLAIDVLSANSNSTNSKNSTTGTKTSNSITQYNLASIGLTIVGFGLTSLYL